MAIVWASWAISGRAQPYGNAQSLSRDEPYAVVARLLFLNDIVSDSFVLTKETFRKIWMPNEESGNDRALRVNYTAWLALARQQPRVSRGRRPHGPRR